MLQTSGVSRDLANESRGDMQVLYCRFRLARRHARLHEVEIATVTCDRHDMYGTLSCKVRKAHY